MELTGEVVMDAPRERVWSALNDAAVLQACIPGCEQVTDAGPDVRQVRVMVKIGPVRARFNGRVALSEVEAPRRCVLAFEGSGGAAGMASGRSQLELHDEGATTRLAYTVKASVGGKLGQVGGRMIDASAKQLADQFFGALRDHLAPRAAVAAAAADATMDARAQAAAPSLSPSMAVAAPARAVNPEVPRLLWFLMGVAATGFGTWLGARLF